MPHDPEHLRAFASRPWATLERLTRARRAGASVEERVRIGIELYEAAKRTRPDWPTPADRQADLDNHLRLRQLLDEAARVLAR